MKTTFTDLVGQSLRVDLERSAIVHLPQGHSTRWRTLPFFMFSQAWEGSERMFLDDGRQVDAVEGQMILLPPGIRHKVDVTSRNESRHWAHVNYTFASGIDLFMVVECPFVVEKDIGTAVGRAVLDLVEKVRSGFPNDIGRIAASQELGAKLLSLIAPVCRVRDDAVHRMRRRERLNTVLRHMHDNLRRPIRRNELAKMTDLSPAQFHTVFTEVTGTTPMAYLRNLRMRRALKLLTATPMPVGEIAERCGYGDQFVFCKLFRRYSGHSPTEFRATIRS